MLLLAAAMDFTTVTATEGNGELIADLAANRATLRKSEMGDLLAVGRRLGRDAG